MGRAASDPAAFGRLYELHYSRILTYLYRRTLDIDLAEELTSNTFFKALRGLHTYRGRAPFGAWLYRIASREVSLHRRSVRRRPSVSLLRTDEVARVSFRPGEMETAEQIHERLRRHAVVHECLLALPQRHQAVLVLRYFEGLSLEQISQVLDKKLGTVKSLIHRGLKRLRRQICRKDATFLTHWHPPK
jgi:RNA polymerase sigma-70 factor (ECF subfamily)